MIVITGSLAYDYIMAFPSKFGDHILPDQIHNVNLSFIVSTFAKRRGGTAGNVSYTMGLLQTPHILYSTAGKDFTEYKEVFKQLGINTTYIAIDKNEYTATGFALTDKTNNQIWGYYYGAAANNYTLLLNKIKQKINLVLIGPQGTKGSMSFVNQCISQKLPYMFDPGFILTEVTDTDLTRGVSHAEYIIGNEYELELMQKRVKDFDKITVNKTVITTLGEKGAVIKNNNKTVKIKAVKVKNISSTTGAGDAWRGGFLAGLQKKFDMQVCGQMGAVASAFAVEHFGTQEQHYSLKQFQTRYRQTYNSLLKL